MSSNQRTRKPRPIIDRANTMDKVQLEPNDLFVLDDDQYHDLSPPDQSVGEPSQDEMISLTPYDVDQDLTPDVPIGRGNYLVAAQHHVEQQARLIDLWGDEPLSDELRQQSNRPDAALQASLNLSLNPLPLAIATSAPKKHRLGFIISTETPKSISALSHEPNIDEGRDSKIDELFDIEWSQPIEPTPRVILDSQSQRQQTTEDEDLILQALDNNELSFSFSEDLLLDESLNDSPPKQLDPIAQPPLTSPQFSTQPKLSGDPTLNAMDLEAPEVVDLLDHVEQPLESLEIEINQHYMESLVRRYRARELSTRPASAISPEVKEEVSRQEQERIRRSQTTAVPNPVFVQMSHHREDPLLDLSLIEGSLEEDKPFESAIVHEMSKDELGDQNPSLPAQGVDSLTDESNIMENDKETYAPPAPLRLAPERQTFAPRLQAFNGHALVDALLAQLDSDPVQEIQIQGEPIDSPPHLKTTDAQLAIKHEREKKYTTKPIPIPKGEALIASIAPRSVSVDQERPSLSIMDQEKKNAAGSDQLTVSMDDNEEQGIALRTDTSSLPPDEMMSSDHEYKMLPSHEVVSNEHKVKHSKYTDHVHEQIQNNTSSMGINKSHLVNDSDAFIGQVVTEDNPQNRKRSVRVKLDEMSQEVHWSTDSATESTEERSIHHSDQVYAQQNPTQYSNPSFREDALTEGHHLSTVKSKSFDRESQSLLDIKNAPLPERSIADSNLQHQTQSDEESWQDEPGQESMEAMHSMAGMISGSSLGSSALDIPYSDRSLHDLKIDQMMDENNRVNHHVSEDIASINSLESVHSPVNTDRMELNQHISEKEHVSSEITHSGSSKSLSNETLLSLMTSKGLHSVNRTSTRRREQDLIRNFSEDEQIITDRFYRDRRVLDSVIPQEKRLSASLDSTPPRASVEDQSKVENAVNSKASHTTAPSHSEDVLGTLMGTIEMIQSTIDPPNKKLGAVGRVKQVSDLKSQDGELEIRGAKRVPAVMTPQNVLTSADQPTDQMSRLSDDELNFGEPQGSKLSIPRQVAPQNMPPPLSRRARNQSYTTQHNLSSLLKAAHHRQRIEKLEQNQIQSAQSIKQLHINHQEAHLESIIKSMQADISALKSEVSNKDYSNAPQSTYGVRRNTKVRGPRTGPVLKRVHSNQEEEVQRPSKVFGFAKSRSLGELRAQNIHHRNQFSEGEAAHLIDVVERSRFQLKVSDRNENRKQESMVMEAHNELDESELDNIDSDHEANIALDTDDLDQSTKIDVSEIDPSRSRLTDPFAPKKKSGKSLSISIHAEPQISSRSSQSTSDLGVKHLEVKSSENQHPQSPDHVVRPTKRRISLNKLFDTDKE